MLIDVRDEFVTCIQFRICLSWYELGLKELYDILKYIQEAINKGIDDRLEKLHTININDYK